MIITEILALTGASKATIYRWMGRHPTADSMDADTLLGHPFPLPTHKVGRVVHWDAACVRRWWDENASAVGRHPTDPRPLFVRKAIARKKFSPSTVAELVAILASLDPALPVFQRRNGMFSSGIDLTLRDLRTVNDAPGLAVDKDESTGAIFAALDAAP